MKTVWLKFTAFSNITYLHEYDTGKTREQWDAMSREQRDRHIDEGIWSDIEHYEEDQDGDEEDCE